MEDRLIDFFNQSAQAIAVLVAPPLLAASVLGVMLALLQSAMHLQDQTLPQLVKLVTIAMFLFFYGSALTAPIVALADAAFGFAAVVR